MTLVSCAMGSNHINFIQDTGINYLKLVSLELSLETYLTTIQFLHINITHQLGSFILSEPNILCL